MPCCFSCSKARSLLGFGSQVQSRFNHKGIRETKEHDGLWSPIIFKVQIRAHQFLPHLKWTNKNFPPCWACKIQLRPHSKLPLTISDTVSPFLCTQLLCSKFSGPQVPLLKSASAPLLKFCHYITSTELRIHCVGEHLCFCLCVQETHADIGPKHASTHQWPWEGCAGDWASAKEVVRGAALGREGSALSKLRIF